MKPVLYVLQESPFLIKLKKGENVSDTLWEFTLVWWTNKKNTSNDEIEIPINEFISKKNWLRTNWIREGGNVVIDHEARSTIKIALNQFVNFKEFINNNIYDDQNFDDSKLKRTLTSFQKRDINRLLKLPNGANFSVPGAGKTTSTLVIWDFLRQKNTIDKLLVVCPKSAFEAWNEEPKDVFKSILTISVFENKPIEIDTDIIICNYEKLESQINRQHLINWMTSKKVMLVLDEAHRVKGGTKSVRWFGCRELSHHALRVELLSGTPMPQGYQDLRNLFSLSWPNVPQTYFTDELFKNLKRGSLFVRTTKNELGLNPPIIVSHDIEMGKIQKDVYTALCRSYRGAFTLTDHDESYFGAKGRAVMTLLAVATNPGLLNGITNDDAYLGLEWPPKEINNNYTLLDIVAKYASHEIPPKYKWLIEFCENANRKNKKLLIWTNFVGNILALNKLLKKFNPAIVYGAIKDADRKREINRFRTDSKCNILISNPQTLGEGISLHKVCHDAIYMDRSYNAGHYLQSLDRIHRLGLPVDQETSIHILSTKETIDQRVGIRLEQKIERLSDALKDEGLIKSSLPDEELILPNELLGIDKFDLDDLLSHLTEDESSSS